ncbi:MAG: 4-phosphoerythronate dehydrogenase [Bacteroidetes bacterium]|nr:MAG: 4-phosphoerythronate dehydrogenase [Bacteroidota bacterium]
MLLKIVSDANVPFVEEAMSPFGTLELVPGHEITSSRLIDADALIVRSVTSVDESLLTGSSVRFVGSATAGFDHIDREYLKRADIAWAHAPGCNAESVVEWVLAALFHLSQLHDTPILASTLGIVGCGEIGSRLERRAAALGMRVLVNDPPRARKASTKEEQKKFVPLKMLLEESDIVSLHVPLKVDGIDATWNLIGDSELARMKKGVWVLNSSRGGVINEAALVHSIETGQVGAAAVDVWEGEPNPDRQLEALVDICSPHIAGYSRNAKRSCTETIAKRAAIYFSIPRPEIVHEKLVPKLLNLPKINPSKSPEAFIHSIVQQMYRIDEDVDRMRSRSDQDGQARETAFRQQRWAYPPRYTFSQFQLPSKGVTEEWQSRLSGGLKIEIVDPKVSSQE